MKDLFLAPASWNLVHSFPVCAHSCGSLPKVNESLKGETAELRKDLEGEQERAGPVREEADTLRNKVRAKGTRKKNT